MLDVANVVWCTGFHPGFSWIDLPVFDEHGEPKHERGAVGRAGALVRRADFLYSLSSDVLPGVGRDADYVARHIADRRGRAAKAPSRALATA